MLPLTVAAPDGDAPALVVVPSIFGLTDDLGEQMRELSAGAVVIGMDPFWRVEPGPIPYGEVQRAFERVGQLDVEAAYGDFATLARWARSHPRCNGKVCALGICFGGPFCLLGAADGLLDGVVTWHGSRMQDFLDRAAEMRCPMKHHLGAEDTVVPPDAVAALRAAFAGRDDVEFAVHPGAGHGFSHRGADAHVPAAEAAAMAAAATLCTELG